MLFSIFITTLFILCVEISAFGYSRPKRLNHVANETELLNRVAQLMHHAREKDLVEQSNVITESQSTDIGNFGVFPDTQKFDQIHIKVRREVLSITLIILNTL
jgi:hypothetical protein